MKFPESEVELNKSNDKELQDEKTLKIDNEKLSDVDLPAEPSIIKPNNFPAAVLILTFILANIEVSEGLTCSSSRDIRWISKSTNKLVGCSPCPPCPPSQEFSIPCGTQAYIGTTAKCIPCPQGKYSNGFNFKSCVSCTICSNKIVKQKCTLFRNSICGDCKPGFYYENVSFSCMKCGRCCHDGQDEAPSSCTAVNLCKSRPNGCPLNRTNIPTIGLSATVTPPTVKSVIASFINKEFASTSLGHLNNHTPWSVTATPQTTKPTIQNPLNKQLVLTTPNHDSQELKQAYSSIASQSDNGSINMHNPWIIAVVVILSVVVLVLIIIIIILKALHQPRKSNDNIPSGIGKVETQYTLVSQKASPPHDDIPMTDMLNNDQTLENFVHKNYLAVDKLCKVLFNKKLGKWDFERVANEWKVEKEDVLCIKNEVHADQGSPVRKLLDVLCSQRLCSTVRQLANSLKSINEDAYEILEPHFLKPTEVTGTGN